MEVEGCCFIAGMGAVLILMPLLGLWGRRRQEMDGDSKEKR